MSKTNEIDESRETDRAHDSAANSAHERAWELARQQGVKPIKSIKELHGDFWPEDESVDEFLARVNALRGNDKPLSVPK